MSGCHIQKPLLHIIGAGRLGKTLGRLMVIHDCVTLGALLNTTTKSTREALDFIGQGVAVTSLKALPPADFICITAKDTKITNICDALVYHQKISKNCVVFHCSGTLSSDVLHPVRSCGGWVASLHPMRSFANPKESVLHYAGTLCAIEGDPQALLALKPLFESIGSRVIPIDTAKKPLYHAAAVLASNYLVTLCEQVLFCLREAGIHEQEASSMMMGLMESTLDNISNVKEPKAALTGPIHRRDFDTVLKHLKALNDYPKLKQLYALLGEMTIALEGEDIKCKKFKDFLGTIDA